MTTEVIDGTLPAGTTSEQATTAAAQTNAVTTNAQTDGAEGGEKESGAPKTFTQDELDAIVQKRVAKAERRAENRVLRTLERLPQHAQQQASTQQAADDGKPLRGQFATEDEWLDARDAWRDEKRQAKDAQDRQSREVESLSAKTDKVWAAAQKLPGFDSEAFDDMADSGHLTRDMVKAVIDLDDGPSVLAFLATHPEEAERISKLSPHRQAAEIGKLEAKATAAPPKTSKAPDPIKPIGSGKTPIVDLANADMDAYVQKRKEQGAAWAR
jgi:hypothetical protein